MSSEKTQSATRSCRRVALTLVLSILPLTWVGCDRGDGDGNQGAPFPGGFIGLTDTANNVTNCGECHQGQQENWAQTGHARAYETLAEIGRESPDLSCAGCHNVSEQGNASTDETAGFVSAPDPALRNVQCESCHGPGESHVANTSVPPEVTLAVSTETSCGECHQDEHHPFVEEWSESAHARSVQAGAAFGRNVAADPECAYCHVAQSFIRFIESGGTEKLVTSDPQPITCVTCHDPHGNGNKAQVRVLEDQAIVCGVCHTSGGAVVGDTPHHPQADMLLATNGFFFPGATNPGPATHGSIENNPDLCATCHIATRPFQGGEEPIAAQVGHTFEPIPVVDEATGERNFDACLACHANPEEVLEQQQSAIRDLMAELEAALEAVPEDQQGSDTYEGAAFNLELVQADASTGVHNPRLSILLLQSSIDALAAL